MGRDATRQGPIRVSSQDLDANQRGYGAVTQDRDELSMLGHWRHEQEPWLDE
jgi:hypothetical protein